MVTYVTAQQRYVVVYSSLYSIHSQEETRQDALKVAFSHREKQSQYLKRFFLARHTMDAAGEILGKPRPSSCKAKALLGKPERSFEEGSTTDG